MRPARKWRSSATRWQSSTGPASIRWTVLHAARHDAHHSRRSGADVRESALDKDPAPQMYRPIDVAPPNAAIVVRGVLPPAALSARLTDAMLPRRADASGVQRSDDGAGDRCVDAPAPNEHDADRAFRGPGVGALGLGVYAVVAYGVAQRTREFASRGTRATGRDLLTLVSREMVVAVSLVLRSVSPAPGLEPRAASLLYRWIRAIPRRSWWCRWCWWCRRSLPGDPGVASRARESHAASG